MLEGDQTIKPNMEEVKDAKGEETNEVMTPVIYHLVYAQPVKDIYKWLSDIEMENIITKDK